jgi:hypothetical protein
MELTYGCSIVQPVTSWLQTSKTGLQCSGARVVDKYYYEKFVLQYFGIEVNGKLKRLLHFGEYVLLR